MVLRLDDVSVHVLWNVEAASCKLEAESWRLKAHVGPLITDVCSLSYADLASNLRPQGGLRADGEYRT